MSKQEKIIERLHKNFKDYIFLCVILTFHFIVTYSIYSSQVSIIRENKYFDFAVNAEVDIKELQSRLEHYADILYSFRGVFANEGLISKSEWDVYVDSFKLLERYPGITALGYAHKVTSENIDEYSTLMNNTYTKYEQYADGFKVFPDTDENVKYVLTYRSPFEPTKQSIGFDLYSEVSRRDSIDIANEKKVPISTKKIDFAYSIEGETFFVYLPAQYKNEVIGELILAFQIDNLIRDVYPKYYSSNITGLEIFDITDSNTLDLNNLIFSGLDIEMTDIDPIEFDFLFGERKWLIRLVPSSYYLPTMDELAFANSLFFILSITGATLSILFYQLILDKIKSSTLFLKSINNKLMI